MSRPGVTYQDIVNATAALKSQNKNITIENIRTYLGTGSIGTINKYLRQWRDIQTTTGQSASKENLPEELISVIKHLWENVLTHSSQRTESITADYQQDLVHLKNELEKYRNNNQRWQKLFTQWQEEKLMLEQALDVAQNENHLLKKKYEDLLRVLQAQKKIIA